MKTSVLNSIKGILSFHDGLNYMWTVVTTLLLLMSSVAFAQRQDTITYYLKIEALTAGNKVTYIDANEMCSSEPRQSAVIKCMHATINPANKIELHESCLSENEEMQNTVVPNSAVTTTFNVSSHINSIRIMNRAGSIFFDRKNINANSFNVDISNLKNGLYVMEILSN